MVTVRELIIILIEKDMDDEVIVQNELGERIHKINLVARKSQDQGLGALFG